MVELKGSLLSVRFDYLAAKASSEQRQQVLAALSPELRQVTEQGFLSVKWYPFVYFVELAGTIDRVLGNGDGTMLVDMGHFAAHAVFRGIYRFFVRLGSVEFVIKRAANVWRQFYTVGSLATERDGKNSVIITLHDFPEPNEELLRSLQGWFSGTAEVSGEKNVETTIVHRPTVQDTRYVYRTAWD